MSIGWSIPRGKPRTRGVSSKDLTFKQRKKSIKKLKSLGGGAFGVAYSGTLSPYGKVVVKVAFANAAGVTEEDALIGLAHEIRVLSMVQKLPFVSGLLEVGKDYFVTEDVNGIAVVDVLAEEGLEAREIISVAVSVAIIATKLHEEGIAHGDMYERNILMAPNGLVVIDFGIAVVKGEKNPFGLDFKFALERDVHAVIEVLRLATYSSGIPSDMKNQLLAIQKKYEDILRKQKYNRKTTRKIAEDLIFILAQAGAMRKRTGKQDRGVVKF